jgi:hypothetical protein
MEQLLGPSGALAALPAANQRVLTGPTFFPQLIAAPFHEGLLVVFGLAAALAVLGALASFSRGGRYVHPGDVVTLAPQQKRREPVAR